MGWAVDLAGREQAGGNCEERQGEDGGKETSRTLWCPSRALGKQNKTKQKNPSYNPYPSTLEQPPRM
jgi:hypothetical protein